MRRGQLEAHHRKHHELERLLVAFAAGGMFVALAMLEALRRRAREP